MADTTRTRPDMSAIGSAATASKQATQGSSKSLSSFSVKKGDNGGVIVSETYESKPPAGRRAGASFPDRSDYKENPFGPSDQATALAHVRGLLSQMTGGMAPEAPAAPPRAAGMIETPRASAAAIGGPAGTVARVAPPMRPPMPPYGGAA